MEVRKKGLTIQSLQIGIDIIDVISKQGKPLKFTDIQQLTQMTKSNLYKYLNTLVQTGLLYRDKASGHYTLGAKLIQYGMAAADQGDALARIVPFLEKMNQETLCTVLYVTWTHEGPMIIKIVNTNPGFNIGAQIGTILPLTSSAGKIFLAFADEIITHSWRERESRKRLPDQLQNLDQEIRLIQRREIAFTKEPIISSISSISIPVFNYGKKLLGAVVIVGFNEQIPTSEEDETSKYIKEMGKEISKIFGYEKK